MLNHDSLIIGLAMMVVSVAVGLGLGYSLGAGSRGMCKSYNVEATNQTVEICTRIMK